LEITGTSQDITERKLAEIAHARLATAVAQAAETIVITDLHGTILYANPAFELTTGYTCAEAIGRNPRLLKSGRQDPDFYRQMWECLARGEVWTGHFVNRRKDGTLFEEEATISPVRDAAGRIVNYVAVKRDVTREVQLESRLRQAQKMEAVGQLAGGVAHDFNNILAAVLMYIGLLQLETALDPATQSSLKELSKEIQRGSALTRQLLAFSRQQAMEPRRLDLHRLVGGLLDMLRRLLGEDITIELAGAEGAMNIEADAGMIEQVVMNLCINARDAMALGGRLNLRTVSLVIAPTAPPEPGGARPGRFVRLSVSDTGTGMSEETLQHIFEPFFTTKHKGYGTGLGLATVYGIVQQHRGWVTVESTLGQGTTFHVHLPESGATNFLDEGSEAQPPARGRGETILLVEDEPSLRSTVAKTLRRHGYVVLEAADGPAALDIWQRAAADIDLLLTDLVMPKGMSGQDLIQRLTGEDAGLKVIATTGYSPQDPKSHASTDHRVARLNKPFDRTQLLTSVRTRLDQT
jgi:PAS domain S-box-containing protein